MRQLHPTYHTDNGYPFTIRAKCVDTLWLELFLDHEQQVHRFGKWVVLLETDERQFPSGNVIISFARQEDAIAAALLLDGPV
jgi:hypothetical protein